jgi:photosystem II stability/assembly factor-like uncharacterized protein
MKIALYLCVLISAAVIGHSEEWKRSRDLPVTAVYSFVEHRGALLAISDSVIYRSTDHGGVWQPTAGQPPIGSTYSVLASTHDALFLGSNGYGVYRSTDAGATWHEMNSGLTGWALSVYSIVIHGDTVFAGTSGSGVYVNSVSNPGLWKTYNEGLWQGGVETMSILNGQLFSNVGMYPYRRALGGDAWKEIVFDPDVIQRPAKSFHNIHDTIYAGTGVGVYRSTDLGETWEKKPILGLDNRTVVALTSWGTRLYAAVRYNDEHFIWTTDDGGESWQILAHEFAPVYAMSVRNGKLWSCRNDGLWSLIVDQTTDVPSAPSLPAPSSQLLQNYPNPVIDRTMITYTLDRPDHVTLTLIDAVGATVATLVDGTVSEGEHHVPFDRQTLPTGAYHVMLRSGAGTHTNLLVVQ